MLFAEVAAPCSGTERRAMQLSKTYLQVLKSAYHVATQLSTRMSMDITPRQSIERRARSGAIYLD